MMHSNTFFLAAAIFSALSILMFLTFPDRKGWLDGCDALGLVDNH
jgi:hypothetical protein